MAHLRIFALSFLLSPLVLVACAEAAADGEATTSTTAVVTTVSVTTQPVVTITTVAAVTTTTHNEVLAAYLDLVAVRSEKARMLERVARLEAATTTTVAATPVPAPTPPSPAPPLPQPPPAAAASGSVEGIIRAAALEFGVNGDLLVSIMRCESGLNPSAVNSSSGALGLGQHLPRYWSGRAAALGYSYDDWSNPVANARVSAKLMAEGGPGHWAACL